MASGPGQGGAAPALRGAAGLSGAWRSQGAGEPRRHFRRAARALAHLCGLSLWRKRYVGKSPVIQWAIFHLKRQTHLGSDLLFNINNYSTTNLRGDFEKLKHLLYICPKERSQQDLRQIQTCLKKNRTFQCLPNKTQLQLCHAVVYQECEAGTIIIRQGHVPSECYLILSGKLKVLWGDANFKAQTFTSEILCEAEEGDFIGEICLLTNTNRSASIICKSDVELLVINKEDFDCILSDLLHEQYHATCNFLRKLTLFSSWPAEEIDFLVHCSLQRFYRTGTTVVPESLNSYFLVVVKSGRCLIVTQVDQERLYAHSNEMQNFSSLCDDFITISSLKEKKDLTRRLWERSLYSAAQRTPLTQMPRRPRPQTAAVLCYSLRDRKAFGDLEQKGNEALHANLIEGVGEKVAETKRSGRKQKVASSAPQFLKIRALEQGGIFISEGAECIFIPKKLFLDKAPVKSRKMALELVKSYPSESIIMENYARHQAWNTYKAKLIAQQLERQAMPTSARFSF
ncbi:cyclic nucleotide-binding domain-containing protein 2-like isoform X2 [Mauremys mutica]|uniref:cyclic nucleotide-binding domain-containing protein 2-like isoform X2 n=1 Tax=Mauremys mutica TaxID=74926 RepID=UPI001D16058D|nr:cyclic nucleotide-binding domain-containing protein 2-like isoform X2 [Mauremys mutica]